ncbi:MAG: hypothetical protein KA210_02315 [Bacteroidia bacterium]|nr:hypothetical protein [Bacteroidia bacterium]
MTLEQFLKNYYCKVDIQNQGNINLAITTEAIRRVDNVVVDRVKTNYDIQDMAQKIGDSQIAISLTPFDWEKVVDHTKSAHIDYFAQRAPINDFYSLDRQTNSDIPNFYQ